MKFDPTPRLEQMLRQFFSVERRGLLAVYLYEPLVRDQASRSQPLDIALLYESEPPATLESFPTKVEEHAQHFTEHPVRAIVLNHAPPDLTYHVLRRGKLLFDPYPLQRKVFEMQARSRYHDMYGILRRCYHRTYSSVSSTDRRLVEHRLGQIEASVEELRTQSRPVEIDRDLRERRFVERTLLIAIQAALDVASYVVADRYLGEPTRNDELFVLLGQRHRLPEDLAGRLADMVRLRDFLIYKFKPVDAELLAHVIQTRLEDLLTFAEAVRRRIDIRY